MSLFIEANICQRNQQEAHHFKGAWSIFSISEPQDTRDCCFEEHFEHGLRLEGDLPLGSVPFSRGVRARSQWHSLKPHPSGSSFKYCLKTTTGVDQKVLCKLCMGPPWENHQRGCGLNISPEELIYGHEQITTTRRPCFLTPSLFLGLQTKRYHVNKCNRFGVEQLVHWLKGQRLSHGSTIGFTSNY